MAVCRGGTGYYFKAIKTFYYSFVVYATYYLDALTQTNYVGVVFFVGFATSAPSSDKESAPVLRRGRSVTWRGYEEGIRAPGTSGCTGGLCARRTHGQSRRTALRALPLCCKRSSEADRMRATQGNGSSPTPARTP